jgi:hypothetical protein
MKMLPFNCALLLLGLVGICHAKETSHYEVVSEYVRELRVMEDLRTQSLEEMNGDAGKSKELMADFVHNSTLEILELKTNVSTLKEMTLATPFDTLISSVIDIYTQKIALYTALREVSEVFLQGPKEGVDYSAISTRVPEIRAENDYLDKTLFEATPLFFALLIDQRPDRDNHLSHLVITNSQRQQLISTINSTFGKKLDQSGQNYTVNSASVLRSFLLGNHKSADDPW